MSPVETLPPDEVERIRNDFPLLERRIGDHQLIYLDSGATAQRPISVLDAVQEFDEMRNAAVHRGAHTLAGEATELFEEARHKVASFVGADDDEIAWTKNATEALNAVAYGFVNATAGRGGEAAQRFMLRPGDEIVVTEMEHHANLVPWQEVAAHTGATLRYIPLSDNGTLDMDAAEGLIGEHTRVLAFTHVSNVLGTINQVGRLVELAQAAGAYTVLDACQSAPHLPLDLHALGVDFAAFSGHKMLGPTGVGALYGRSELLNALPPFITGGSMITTVTMEHTDFMPAPTRFEAGTQMVAQAVGFGAAADYLSHIGLDRIAAHEHALGQRLAEGVSQIPGVRLLGPAAGIDRAGMVSVDVDGVHAHDVGQFLDDRGIAVRVGHHCAQPVHRRYGVTASTRASVYLYTTEAEVDAFLNGLSDVRGFFGADR
ncbi:aminotransferase class V-fold PLP-dependent enzyme [Pseudoclavibacter sp. CFCC 11306]|uniref:aminotransferase class V-fold PLP-dependent enzyme n=1 Tax=Pseudoclavibacter sp. CFCC 11306 TaxID=1564493 RepID=UPI0013011CE0|nr:SufS family cysteine desulfurase [Pseudoclavibacter sp. CFCC 11306]KAB1658672.1 SufS family cysteine desulfurase [Pseudoclavibacter sp. CFCC 11306]